VHTLVDLITFRFYHYVSYVRTGVGKHSKQPYVPVLRPGVMGMLLEEQDPPLQAYYAQGNAGRLVDQSLFYII
jgi:hypothetical protein